MEQRKNNKRRAPIPPQEDLYADYYPEEDPYGSGGAHLTPEDRERYYAERDAYYARRDAYYAQRDAYYAQMEAEEDWDEDEEDYEEEEPAPPPPRKRRERTDRRDYAPEDEAPPVKKRRRKKRHTGRRVLLLLLIGALIALLWGTPPVRNPENAAREPGHSTILLAGVDQGGSRTDTIMLLSLERGRTVRLLSIPRDTYTPYYTTYKLNAVYGAAGGGKAGMELLMEEVSHYLGFAPDGYMLVNMEVVERAVDVMGGADYAVPMDMDYEDPDQGLSIHLRAGEQHLNGEQVVGLLRFRSGYANADIGRTEVQRDFIRAALGQWLTVSNLKHLPALLELYFGNVTSSLSARNLLWMARVLLKADLHAMVTEVLPGWADMVDGSSVYMVDQAAAATVCAAYDPYK